MLNRVITISREFGSGGRTIGKRVAEKLGIPCYDAELIQKIAEESGYTADYILRGKANCLNAFIHASMEKRTERIVKEYGEREESS